MKFRLAAVAALGVLALAGCAGKSAPPSTAGANPPPPATSASAPPPAQGKPITLGVGQTSLGQALTLGGRTVYRFESDTNKPPKSVCEGQCLTAWPPLLTDATPVKVSAEIDSTKVGTLTRPDGTVQVTLNGWPLYLFAKDQQPGDVKGEGVSGKWSVVGADAKPLKPKAV
jgi:predicted lipoprotein with Yx(FWY)xxD motif